MSLSRESFYDKASFRLQIMQVPAGIKDRMWVIFPKHPEDPEETWVRSISWTMLSVGLVQERAI